MQNYQFHKYLYTLKTQNVGEMETNLGTCTEMGIYAKIGKYKDI